MTTVDDCVFCRIVAGDVPAAIVAQSDRSVAFRDIAPQAPVHVLVVPRQHVDDAAAVSSDHADDVADLIVTARAVAETEGIRDSGYRLIFNVGDDALNSVGHLHLHVLGGRRMHGGLA